jgi:hypothetical protein
MVALQASAGDGHRCCNGLDAGTSVWTKKDGFETARTGKAFHQVAKYGHAPNLHRFFTPILYIDSRPLLKGDYSRRGIAAGTLICPVPRPGA